MAKYKVTFKKSVAKDLRNIPNKDAQRILQRINGLAESPRAEDCIKLTGHQHYRARLGVYRIIYEIRDDVLIINVIKIGHRSAVY